MNRHGDAETRGHGENIPASPLLRVAASPFHFFRRLLQNRPIHFTRFGWFYISFSLAVGAAAINTGNNLLYVMLGLLLGFIIISGFFSDSCLWGLQVEFQPAGDLYAGRSGEWDLIARKSWFPAIAAWVQASWENQTTRYFLYWVPRYGSASLRFSWTPLKRGRLVLKEVRAYTHFPFGLFEKSHALTSAQDWVVFPRVQRLPLQELLTAGLHLSDQPSARKGWGATPFDLREYRAGDSSKRIHWKSSAKRGALMITEMEEEGSAGRQILVTGWPADRLEDFISFAASLVYTLSQQGLGVGLQTPGAFFALDRSRSQLKKILTYLALVDPDAERPLARPGDIRGIDALDLWKKWTGAS
jgi:uncharacterized protein (DUF58 family)